MRLEDLLQDFEGDEVTVPGEGGNVLKRPKLQSQAVTGSYEQATVFGTKCTN